jgi:steroid Delta-isomerase
MTVAAASRSYKVRKGMATEQQMKQAMQAYIDLYNKDDLEGVVGLYADNATVEDPVGTPVKSGRAAIHDFYKYAMTTGARLSLAAPIRGSHGNSAAMAFDVKLKYEGTQMVIRVIDVMAFDAAGKFASMKAYWGPSDMQK